MSGPAFIYHGDEVYVHSDDLHDLARVFDDLAIAARLVSDGDVSASVFTAAGLEVAYKRAARLTRYLGANPGAYADEIPDIPPEEGDET